MGKNFLIFSSILGVVSGIAGIISLIHTNPVLAYISFSVLLFATAALLLRKILFAQIIIRNCIKTILRKLNRQNYNPDVIIAFSRSGAIAAGAIAINLSIQKVIVIPRILNEEISDMNHERRFYFDNSVLLQSDSFNDKKILVVAFSMFTSETVKAGIEYLDSNNINPSDLKVATISVSDGAIRAFPDVIYSKRTNRPENYLNYIPWLLDKYPLV
jgi:hypoxanthine phosphoribosyltransferase